MTLNDAPNGERTRIAFFGVRNAGKSSLVNAITGQDLAVVSDTLGTTTDIVSKNMELLPLGPVTIIDTPGIDDAGELGQKRIKKTRQALRSCDMAVLVVDATCGMQQADEELLDLFVQQKIPYLIAWNKSDLLQEEEKQKFSARGNGHFVSASVGTGVWELKEALAHMAPQSSQKRLVADLLHAGDVVILVIPIDSGAPKGRIILPQQMVMRDILDAHATAFVCQPQELAVTLRKLKIAPRLVITDSQVFESVAKVVPKTIELTSFSILMIRYKGELERFVAGAQQLSQLSDKSHVLISEACTHHRRCDDIATVKLPAWIREFSQSKPHFDFVSGNEFPEDLDGYDLVLHCGGCMINEREMHARMAIAEEANVAMVNYGIAIAHMKGILPRALQALS